MKILESKINNKKQQNKIIKIKNKMRDQKGGHRGKNQDTGNQNR